MRTRIALLLVLLAATVAHCEVLAPPVELLAGLQSGAIQAEFRGAGDDGVTGVLTRDEGGPSGVLIAPGTQFWAQAGGSQGMSSTRGTRGDLTTTRYAQVWIPTACTNIGLRAPGENDVMVPSASPNPDLVALCHAAALADVPHAMIQVAVWAVANDPPRPRIAGYLRQQAADSDGTLTQGGIMEGAAQLILCAGLEPGAFRVFR